LIGCEREGQPRLAVDVGHDVVVARQLGAKAGRVADREDGIEVGADGVDRVRAMRRRGVEKGGVRRVGSAIAARGCVDQIGSAYRRPADRRRWRITKLARIAVERLRAAAIDAQREETTLGLEPIDNDDRQLARRDAHGHPRIGDRSRDDVVIAHDLDPGTVPDVQDGVELRPDGVDGVETGGRCVEVHERFGGVRAATRTAGGAHAPGDTELR